MEATPNTTETIAPKETDKRTDDIIWSDILKLQLDGVMMHITLFEQFKMSDLIGYSLMHKHHAEEEFHTYLHVLNDYMNVYGKIPLNDKVAAPVVKIEGGDRNEKMSKGLKLYEHWENEVCEKLHLYKQELSEGKEYVDELISDVHKELKHINLMENDLYEGQYDELNNWLIKKWGD